MDLQMHGRTAVVTGADSGMGLETARLLLREGVRVLLSDQAEDRLRTAADSLRDEGEVHACAADLTDDGSVLRLRDAALRALGKVDVLVNAGGVTGATGPFHEIGDEGWLRTLDVDLMGAVRTVRAFVPGMVQNGYGRIVLFGSEDAVQPYIDELPYCAAKAAVLNLAKGLSKTYAAHGVLVNAVSPAFIATPMTDAMMRKRAAERGGGFDDAVRTFLDEERPTMGIRRRGEAHEVAAAVVFLCSAQASFITGTNLRVDGGSVATV